MTRNELARIGRDIIADMFRWGVLWEDGLFDDLDLRVISDEETIQTLKKMVEEETISSFPTSFNSYYVNEIVIEEIKNA